MSDLKTQPHDGSVEEFLNSVADKKRKKDSFVVLDIMKKITRQKPILWGPSIIGFGKYHYKYASGHEGDFMKVGFSPRKQALTIYIMPGFNREKELLEKLGKYKTGKSCLYIKSLEDVDTDILYKLISSSYAYMTEKYG